MSYPRIPFAVVIATLLLSLAACSGGSASPTPTPTPGPVTTPEGAVAAVIAREPRLTGIGPLDRNLIGQASWYEVQPASGVGAFLVKIRVGWGDCPAGCINEHTWLYAVQPDGSAVLQSEAGDVVPAEAWPSPGGSAQTGLVITASAGPVCPVETQPPDPACAPRPVVGAIVKIRDEDGSEISSVALDASGAAFVELPPGEYTVEPQPVDGILGTAPPVGVMVVQGTAIPVPLSYDTGIR